MITKEHLFEKSLQIFVHDEVQIVNGCRVLDSVIGNAETNCRKIIEAGEIVAKKADSSCQCFTSTCL